MGSLGTAALVMGAVYLAGYLLTAAVYLWAVGSLGPVGVLAALWAARRWPVDWIDRATNRQK